MPEPLSDIENLQAIKNLAQLVGAYFAELLEQGLTREEALALSVAYTRALIDGSMGSADA